MTPEQTKRMKERVSELSNKDLRAKAGYALCRLEIMYGEIAQRLAKRGAKNLANDAERIRIGLEYQHADANQLEDDVCKLLGEENEIVLRSER